jgi:anthranilate synthase component 1
MRLTTFDEFAELAKRGTFIPVCKEIVADLLTPVSAFLKIAEEADHAFLLESVEGGEQVARYSFLGKDPFMVLRARGGKTLVASAGTRAESDRPFIETLREVMEGYQAPFVAGLPPFTGGAVGYLGYDTAAWFEAVPLEPSTTEDDAGFMLFDTVLVFDHVRHRILIIANARIAPGDDLEAQYTFACTRVDFVERELDRSLSHSSAGGSGRLDVNANMSQTDYEGMVRTAKEHIAAGDVYQVVLSQRFNTAVTAKPFEVYRALRHVNPSPYMYYLRMGGRSVVGASPEMLVRVEGRTVQTHPIAGTRPRGRTKEEDAMLAAELSSSEKERSEHVMLVDLGRNDLGRVCEYGTVHVSRYMEIERYSHVMHLVSVVEGKLAPGMDRLDALASCFPAGTVSGAPKVRAMEIIAELERDRRGVYAGAVGYLDFAGNLDCCITIRTVVMEDGRAWVQAGAGIVADSDPAAEYQETRDKAQAVLRALELAETGL